MTKVTQVMSPNQALTKLWIRYLKNNQIAAMQSNPKSGRLNYRRPVTVDDVADFLNVESDFTPDEVDSAIKQVTQSGNAATGTQGDTPGNTSSSNQVATSNPQQRDVASQEPYMTPGQRQQPKTPLPQQPRGKKYSNDDATDIDFRNVDRRELPNGQRRLAHKPQTKAIREAMRDRAAQLSEPQVEAIFSALSSAKKPPAEQTSSASSLGMDKARQDEINTLKRVIRDTMTEPQRLALWRALTDANESLNEAEINPSDIKSIFKSAAAGRNSPASGMFSFMRKDKAKIDVSDLQKAWQEAGYPDDIRDIESILKTFGFDKKEINKVFTGAFGKSDDGSYNEPTASPTILKIAEYAKKAGIDKDLIAFMQKEYGLQETHRFNGKAVIEDIRRIFTAIVHEERSALPAMIKSAEFKQLGRNRK